MSRIRTLFGLLASVVCAGPALAATADFSGTLRMFIGDGAGIPTTASVLMTGTNNVAFGSAASFFTVPSGQFTIDTTTPIGFTPNSLPNSIYLIRSITNASSSAGAFSGTVGVGPYPGIMGTALRTAFEIGVQPSPTVYGPVVVPVNAGSPGAQTAMAVVLANPLTVSGVANGWTTATVNVSDQTPSAPTGTFASSATIAGTNNLGSTGGSITLVTPFLVRIRGALTDNRAGYATLTLNFFNKVPVPEPEAALMLVSAGVLVFVVRRRAG